MRSHIDDVRYLHQHFFLLLLALVLGNVLEEDRNAALGRINSNVEPCLKPFVPVGCLETLKGSVLHGKAVLLAELRILCVRKDLEYILTQHLLPFESRPFFRGPVPVGESIVRVQREKTPGNALEYLFEILRWFHVVPANWLKLASGTSYRRAVEAYVNLQ